MQLTEGPQIAVGAPEMRFQLKRGYYPQPTWEFNLPAGWACPGADGCLTKADRDTGRRVEAGPDYICYASSAERFPGVRDSRWDNFAAVRHLLDTTGDPFQIPADATHVRIHSSGDFFNPAYFVRWCLTAEAHPAVRFWAFTKSINYWVGAAGMVPPNLELQASRGSKHDHLIDEHSLKCAEVFDRIQDVPPEMPIDVDDSHAMRPGPSFALLNNLKNRDQRNNPAIARHNERAARLTETEQRGPHTND